MLNKVVMSDLRSVGFFCDRKYHKKTNSTPTAYNGVKCMKYLATITITLFLAGCAAGTLSGRLVTQSGKPVIGAEVKLWKNQFSFMSLPENVANTTTDEEGRFKVHAEERVSFVTFDSPTCSGVVNRVSELKNEGVSVTFNKCM